MKVAQSKNYRKPLYAIGLAAAIAVTVTACGSEPVTLAGDIQPIETTEEVQLAGEATPGVDDPDYTEPTKYAKPDGDEVRLAGDVEFFDPDQTT
ncbi:MAG: hypothetical protein IKZ42_08395 [Clostridiales bacterium]|nr:hypothetical protein [Clostridiales bacterium]